MRVRIGRLQFYTCHFRGSERRFWSSLRPEWIGNGEQLASGAWRSLPGGAWYGAIRVGRTEYHYSLETPERDS